jgi:competence protein ComGC
MNTTFNDRNNNNRYLILLSIVSVFSAIVFLVSYENIQSVFANSQGPMKDQMKNMMGMQNNSMMMDQNQKQAMMKQMNKTGMMDQNQKQAMMKQMNKTGMMMGKTNK